MPEHLRALVVILLCATLVFAIARAPACAVAMPADDFRRRRNAWLAVTLAAFLAHNFWVFMLVAAAAMHWSALRDGNKVALYFFLVFALPSLGSEVTGLGIIRHLLSINWLRLLSLVILLPAWLTLRRTPGVPPFGSHAADAFLLGYLGIALGLQLTVDTFTNTLRYTVYAFVDVLLPFYVASRSLSDLARVRDALMAYVVAAMLLVPTAVIEFHKSWLLYGALNGALGVASSELGTYLVRDDVLRAMASVQHPIALGYVMAVALGLFLFLRRSVPSPLFWMAGVVALVAGLIAPMSRGPWLGAVVIVVVFIASGARAAANLLRFGLVSLVVTLVVLLTPLGEKVIRFLPFVGSVEMDTIDYRQRLVEVAIDLVKDNPWFGAFDFVYSPAMQELKQGQGIIDIVNSYVAIALSNGLVGLSMFVLFFVFSLREVILGMAKVADKESELHLLGQALLACMAGILFMISTVSGISVIPTVYWSLAGICVAYAKIVASQTDTSAGLLASELPVSSRQRATRKLRGTL